MMNIDADKFLYDLAQAESSHRPHITSASGSFLGSYQMGKPILQDMGYKNADGTWTGKRGINSREDFLGNGDIQDQIAREEMLPLQWHYIQSRGLDKHIGSTYNGIDITKEGLLAATHLLGAGGVQKMFSGENPADGLGTTGWDYMKRFQGIPVQTGTQTNMNDTHVIPAHTLEESIQYRAQLAEEDAARRALNDAATSVIDGTYTGEVTPELQAIVNSRNAFLGRHGQADRNRPLSDDIALLNPVRREEEYVPEEYNGVPTTDDSNTLTEDGYPDLPTYGEPTALDTVGGIGGSASYSQRSTSNPVITAALDELRAAIAERPALGNRPRSILDLGLDFGDSNLGRGLNNLFRIADSKQIYAQQDYDARKAQYDTEDAFAKELEKLNHKAGIDRDNMMLDASLRQETAANTARISAAAQRNAPDALLAQNEGAIQKYVEDLRPHVVANADIVTTGMRDGLVTMSGDTYKLTPEGQQNDEYRERFNAMVNTEKAFTDQLNSVTKNLRKQGVTVPQGWAQGIYNQVMQPAQADVEALRGSMAAVDSRYTSEVADMLGTQLGGNIDPMAEPMIADMINNSGIFGEATLTLSDEIDNLTKKVNGDDGFREEARNVANMLRDSKSVPWPASMKEAEKVYLIGKVLEQGYLAGNGWFSVGSFEDSDMVKRTKKALRDYTLLQEIYRTGIVPAQAARDAEKAALQGAFNMHTGVYNVQR